MEEERKIEKWLRAFAKKRRGQAGESFKIHPATRRLLQGEVARNVPAQDGDDKSDSPSLWEILRRRWAFLLSFAFCVFLVAIIFFPSRTAKRRSQALTGIAPLKQLNLAAQAPAKEDNGQLPVTLDVVTNNAKLPVVALNNAAAPTAESAAPSIAAAPEGSVSSLANAPAEAPIQVLAEQEKSDRFLTAPAAQPATPPAGVPDSGGHLGTFAFNDKSQRLANSPATRSALVPEMQNSFKNSIAPSQSLSVLASFQVRQNGNALRIIDQDGSIYEGSLQILAGSSVNRQPQAPPRQYQAMQNAVGVATGLPSPPIAQAQNAIHAVQNYFFRVAGTNRTLQQNVTCSGYIVANSLPSTNAQQGWGTPGVRAGGFGGGGGFGSAAAYNEIQANSAATNQLAQLPWQSFRISGSAVVNNTNRIQINAAPDPVKN